MLLPLTLGFLHALEPDHVAVVTGVSLSRPKGAWKVGLAFGLSHMLAVAILALLSVWLGRALFGESFFQGLDRVAWAFVALLGVWNLAAALGWRKSDFHHSLHTHGALVHEHPVEAKAGHRFHHSMAWLGAFFGLGGFRGFMTLMQNGAHWNFVGALLLFGLGITSMFILLSWISGLLAERLGRAAGFRRALFAASGIGNLSVGLWLLLKP